MADLSIGESPGRGRGVFAGRAFRPGEVIETCPVIVVPEADLERIDRTILYNYYFGWGRDAAIALGFGSLYNHSDTPNAAYRKCIPEGVIVITATAPIAPGDEIRVRYDPGSLGTLWFQVQ